MVRPHHIGRRLIAITPILLIMGILAQVILLAAIIVLYVPCLVFPAILDGPYQWITKGMARVFAKSIMGRKPKAGMTAELVLIPLSDTPGSVPPVGRVLMLQWP